MSTLSNNIRQVLSQDILKQESGNQSTFISKLYNCFQKCGWEEYDSKRFVAEYKTNEGRADIVDTVANVVWEMKSSTLDIDSTHGTHAGKQDLNPYQQALGYCRSLGFNQFVITNGRQLRIYTFKDGSAKLSKSFDNFGADLSDDDLVDIIGSAFKGSTIDISLIRMIKNLDTKLDEELDKSDRKTCAAYWSNITKARALFRQSPFYKSVIEQMQQATTADALWAVWKRITSVKVLDPSVGGCALLVAAHAELCDLERRIERRLSFDFDQDIDPFVNVLPTQFYGIEMYDFQFEESKSIARASKALFDSFGAFEDRKQKPYNLLNADALEVSWREFVGADSENDEVVIFANPPFTCGINFDKGNRLEDYQKEQLKRFEAGSCLDIAFMRKAIEEGLIDGIWIVNANSISKYADRLGVPMDLGEVHTLNTEGGIISNGSQPERWVMMGVEGNFVMPKSSKALTNAFVIKGSTHQAKAVVGGVHACSVKHDDFEVVMGRDVFSIEAEDLMIGRFSDQSLNLVLKAPTQRYCTGNLILVKPTKWTCELIGARCFKVWLSRVGSCNGNGQYLPSVSGVFNAFPLFQGDDLDHYNDMSDDEIFQELYQKYQALTNK